MNLRDAHKDAHKDAHRHAHRHAHKDALLALGLVLACTLAVWPGPFAAGALGHPIGDLADHYWGTWWFGGELLEGHWPSRTDQTHLPGGGTLWHVDPVGALIALPLRWLGPTASWNTLIWLQVCGGALAGYGLGKHASGCRTAALSCAVLCGPSAYALGLVHSGLSEYLGLAWPALFVWALLRAHEPGGRAWPAALALLACTLQAFYYGAFGVLLMGCLVLGTGWRARALASVKIGALWALPALGWMAAARATLSDPDAVIKAESAPGWNYQTLPGTDLFSWLHPGAWYHPDTPAFGNPGILHVNYVGWLALGLAAVGILRSDRLRELRLGASAFATFSLGPALSVGRIPVRLGPVAVLLPLALLYAPGSPFRWVHHPYRIAAFLLPLVGVWAALGAARLPRPARWAAPVLLLAEILFISPAPWPLAVSPTTPPAVLAQVGGTGAILDLPPDGTAGNRRALMAQPTHGRGIAYGPNLFIRDELARDPLVHQVLRSLDDLPARARNRDVPARGRLLHPPHAGPSRLGELGFDTVLLHRDLCSEREATRLQRILVDQLGPPAATEGETLAWRIAP